MTEHDYLLAWYVYLAAACCGYLAGWLLTGGLWRWVREPLRLAAAVLLFTPTLVDPGRELYAPALAIAALDILFDAGNSLWRALLDLGAVGALALLAYLLFCLVRWFWLRRRAVRAAASAEPTLQEVLDAPASAGRREPQL